MISKIQYSQNIFQYIQLHFKRHNTFQDILHSVSKLCTDNQRKPVSEGYYLLQNVFTQTKIKLHWNQKDNWKCTSKSWFANHTYSSKKQRNLKICQTFLITKVQNIKKYNLQKFVGFNMSSLEMDGQIIEIYYVIFKIFQCSNFLLFVCF